MLPTPCTTADQRAGLSVQHLGPRSIVPDPSITPDAWVHTLSRPTVAHDLAPIRCSRTTSIKQPLHDFAEVPKGLRGSYQVHKTRVPDGPASQQKLGPADGITTNTRLLGRPRYLTTGRKSDPVSDRKAWPRRGRRSLLTPTRFFDREYAEPLLTALLRPTRSKPIGNDRPRTPAR